LVNGATYYWRVVTLMPTGYAFTETRSFKVSNIPLPPTLEAKIIDGSYWQLAWNKPDSSVTRYELSETANGQTKLIPITNGTAYKPLITGSAAYKIIACNSNGCGSASNVQTINIEYAPATPSIAVTTDVYNQTFLITWGNVGAPKYELQYRGATSQDGLASTSWQGVLIESGFNKTISMLSIAAYSHLQWQVRACTALNICSAWQISRIKTNQAGAITTSVSLLSPANGALIENTTNAPCFQWQFDPFAKEYVVTLSDSTEFTEKRWATTMTTGTTVCWNNGWPKVGIYAGELPVRLFSPATYYWRVVSVAYDGSIGFSGMRSFSMSAIPGVPQLTATISQDKSSWSLQWTRPQGDINKYEIDEDNTKDDGIRWIENYVTNSPDAITFTSRILGETKYKVRACNPQHQCSLYSNVVTTLLETAPAVPADFTINQKVDEQGFELVWSAITKATKYKLQYVVADTAEQAKISTNWIVLDEIDTTKYLQLNVTPYKFYKWRIMACKLSGICSEWAESPVRILQQKPTLISPALISPANGAAVYANNFNTPCLSWALTTEEVRRVTKYAITISPIADFTDRRWHFEVDGRQNQSICWGNGSGWSAKGIYADQLPSGLELNKIYYWRVVAINSHGELGYSETRTFTLSSDPSTNNTGPQIVSKIYEAETSASAKLYGVPIKTNVVGYSGSGFGNYNAAVGSYIEWSVPSDLVTPAILSIRYSNGLAHAIPMDLFLNGTKISSINLASTGAWTNWKHEHITASLAAGVNKIKFVTTTTGDPHVDYLQVSTGAILPLDDIGVPSVIAASANNGKGMQLNWGTPNGSIAYYQVNASYPLDTTYNVASTSFVLPSAYGATYKVRACNASLICGVYSEPIYVTNSTYEAEVASQKIGVQITNTTTGYYGTGFAKFSETGFLEWNVHRSVVESGVLIFTYINAGTTAHNAEITRNGVVVGTLSLPPTGATTWTNISLPISLATGNNYVGFRPATPSDHILVDRLNVQTLTANSPGLPSSGNPLDTSSLIFNLAATDNDGDFIISWSGARSYAELYEKTVVQQEEIFTGLKGKYYGYRQVDNENQDLSKVSQAVSTISAIAPEATFIASSINYASAGGQGLGKGTNLQTFLKGDAASLNKDPADATDGILQLTGRIRLDAGSYNFRVRSDDGYSIRINGAVVAEINANQTAKTTEHTAFNIAKSGEQNIEIIYWDSGWDHTFSIELRSTGGGVYTYLGGNIISHVGDIPTENNLLKRGDGSGNFSHRVFGKAAGKYTYLLKECYQSTPAVTPECINIERSIDVGMADGGAGSSGSSGSSSSISTTLSPHLTSGIVNSPPPTELPGSPVGTIAGQFRVSESGAASYSVPLNLPAGVAGVTPQLSFDYASQSGNGLLGQGWSLSGLSAITRCRQTLIHDGKTNPITWSKEDRFCLDGQRLMLVSGAYYGQPNSEYRTEIDNYSLVTAVGGSDGHPDYFKVEAKDGSVSYYGYTADSKLTGGVQNTTLNWALNRFQDNVGNGIDFVYNNNSTSGQNVHEIRYGFPTPNGVMPSATRTDFKSRIQFSYDERDDKSDAFVAGYKFSQTRKLASVDIYNTDNSSGFESSKLFRHYQLKYMSRTTTDARYENTLTRLSHIYECVTPDIVGGSCLLPLSFSWGGGSHIAFDKNMTELSFPTAEPGRYVLNNLFADVTGDGKADLIYLTYEKGIDETHADLSINIAYAKKDATGLAVQERINLYNKLYENIRIATLDYNADGRQDVAVYDEGHWKVHLAVINADKQWRISKVDVVNLSSLTDKDTLFMDVNGDGLADAVTAQGYYLLKRNANAGHSNTAYSFSLQLTELTWSDTGFAEISAPSPTSISALTNCTQVGASKKLQQETAADFNGDGAVDFLGTYNRTLSCGASGGIQPSHVTLTYRYALVNHNGQLFNYGGAALQTPTTLGGNTDKLFSIDINSDGLSDIVQLGTDKTLSVRMNTGAGFNAVQAWTTLSGLPAGSSPQFLDYNGDGAADVIWRDTTKSQMLVHYWGTAATTTVTLFNTFSSEKDSYLVMDVSGDSVVDYLRISSESMSGRVGQMALKAEPVCETYPTGRGNEMRTHCNDPSYPISQDQQHNAIYKIENGLGNITQITYGALSNSGRYQTADVNPELISNVVSNNCPPNIPAYCSPTYTSYSVDSSGFYGRINGRWELPEDHNVYDPTAKAIVAAGTTTTKGNPVLEVNGSMQVVTMVKSSAPLPNVPSAMSEVNYFYGEAKIQAMGRGFLGFGRLKTVDKQTGVTTVTTYRQDFPFAGSPLSTTVYKNDSPGAPVLSYAINKWNTQVFGGDGTRRFQPYLEQSSEYSYVMDSAGGVSTDALQTVTTDTVMYPNEHGNVHEVTSVTQGSGKIITQKTTNDYYSEDAWALRMGRLKRSSVNTTNLQGDSVARIAEFKYYGVGGEGISGGAKGLLKEEKVITSKASDQLVTEYLYDQWGNKHTVSVTGQAEDGEMQTRSTTSRYDSSGRNLVSTQNHLEYVSTFDQYNVYGQPQAATDKNKLSTEVKYDAFGGEYLRVEKLPSGETGAWTRKDSAYCTPSDCPANAVFYTRSRVSGGGEAHEYFDILGRVIRAGKIGFDGRWVYTDTEYDNLTRVKRQSLPFYAGSSPQDWVENHYDDLGRATQVDSPHEQGTISSKTEYVASPNGLMTTLINPKGQKRKEVRNGLGQLVYVEDELGSSISYEYSILGGLLNVTTRTADAADVVVKMCYDELGRKTGMFDPDKGGFSGDDATCETVNNWAGNASGAVDGWWHYRYNAFGELLEQRDPKGQRTLMRYDELGRMINRKDYESGSHLEAHTAWFYDKPFGESEPTDRTRGRLTAVVMSNNTSVIENNDRSCDKTYNNHCVIYRYNDRALVDMTWTQFSDGQDYFTETQYDDIGRAYEQRDVIEGPIFMASGVQTHFNDFGYAYRTVDIAPWDGTDGVLSTIKEVNVNGQVTKEIRGNGLETVNTYYPKSGLLQSQVAYDALGTRELQSNHYKWDELGNLTSRVNRGAHVFKEGQPLQQNNRKESFCYDALNRLVKTLPTDNPICSGTASPTDDTAYDGLGNITRKNGVGDYSYNRINGGPHAVTKAGNATYSYDNNGNMVAELNSASDLGNRAFKYSSYDMVKEITRDNASVVEFKYGPDRARWQRVDNELTTTTYLGNVERIEIANTHEVEWRRTVAGVVHTYKTTVDSDKQNLQVLNVSKAYLYKDHLGSVDIITDQLGKPTHSMSFDPWGARRKGDSNDVLAWVKNAGGTDQEVLQNMLGSLNLTGFSNPITTRGYTGHEMVDGMDIIHMNGRIYDAKLARFLQADPFIQAATNTQSFNRYSYVMNNPLNATDPSGFLSLNNLNPMSNFERKAIRGLSKVFGAQFVNIVGSTVATYYAGPWGAAAWSYQFTRAMGGSSSQAFSAATVAFVSAAFSQGLSDSGLNFGQQVFASAVFGGVMAELQGGKFGNGFASAGLSSYFGGMGYGDDFGPQGMIVSTIVGGTVSEITGGKFANGAQSAAMNYAAQWGASKIGTGGTTKENTSSSTGTCSNNPINIGTGEKYLTMVDYKAEGASQMTFERYYSSYAGEKTSLGIGWRSNFDRSLQLDNVGDVTLRVVAIRHQGDPIMFNWISDESANGGHWETDNNRYESIRKTDSGWELQLTNNSREIYNAEGRLIAIEQIDGYEQTLVYGDQGTVKNVLLSVADNFGQQLQFAYDLQARMTSMTATDGSVTRYEYDAVDNLAKVISPDETPADEWDNSYVVYDYDDKRFSHAITGIRNSQGQRVHSMAYDEQGRAILSALGDDVERVDMEFSSGENHTKKTLVKNSLGKNTEYTFDQHNKPLVVEGQPTASCIGSNQGYDYNDKGHLTSKTDWNGSTTRYEYNDRGLETLRVEAVGTAEERSVETQWHAQWRLPVQVTAAGLVVEFDYNDAGQLIERIERDTLAELTALQKILQQYPERVWSYGYNAQGLLQSVDGPRTDVQDITEFEYDTNGNRTAVINALGHRSEVIAVNERGLPEQVRDANGLVTELKYNSRGWLTSKTVQSDKGDSTTVYHYSGISDYGNQGLISSVTLPNGEEITYEYDSARRLVAQHNKAGERLEYSLDMEGNRTEQRIYNATGALTFSQAQVFDELSRLLASIGADGNAIGYGYDKAGNRTSATDALGHNTSYAYDALNRLIATTDALDGAIKHTYDNANRVTSITDQRGLSTQYRYNSFGNKIAQVSPDTGETQYGYDEAGNMVSKTDARGVLTEYRYDVLGRVTDVIYPAANDDNIHYRYDNQQQTNSVGRVSHVSDASGEQVYSYNQFGQVSVLQSQIGVTRYNQAYDYDRNGQLVTQQYPSGRRVSYHYDAQGHLATVDTEFKDRSENVLTHMRHQPFGPLTTLGYGNGTQLQIGQDNNYRIRTQQLFNAANDPLYHRGYDYDANSNIVGITDYNKPAANQVFVYDALSRLTDATGNYGTLGYGYDAVGNRISRTQNNRLEDYTYAENSNRLLNVISEGEQGDLQTRTLDYDAVGNITSDSANLNAKILGFGANNRLEQVTVSNGNTDTVAAYQYNAKGQRVVKQVNGKTLHFHYDTENRLLAETTETGTPIREYIYAANQRIALVDYQQNTQGVVYFMVNDHLGTPQLLLDAQQQVVWSVNQSPFGEVKVEGSVEQPLRFPGQYADVETGYSYNYFRDYDPTLGRYIESDPIGLEAGVNTFGYVMGNPVLNNDSYGLTAETSGSGNYYASEYLAFRGALTLTNTVSRVPPYSAGSIIYTERSHLNFAHWEPTHRVLGIPVWGDLHGRGYNFSRPHELANTNSFYDIDGFTKKGSSFEGATMIVLSYGYRNTNDSASILENAQALANETNLPVFMSNSRDKTAAMLHPNACPGSPVPF